MTESDNDITTNEDSIEESHIPAVFHTIQLSRKGMLKRKVHIL